MSLVSFHGSTEEFYVSLVCFFSRFCFENVPLETREKMQVNPDRCFVRQAWLFNIFTSFLSLALRWSCRLSRWYCTDSITFDERKTGETERRHLFTLLHQVFLFSFYFFFVFSLSCACSYHQGTNMNKDNGKNKSTRRENRYLYWIDIWAQRTKTKRLRIVAVRRRRGRAGCHTCSCIRSVVFDIDQELTSGCIVVVSQWNPALLRRSPCVVPI